MTPQAMRRMPVIPESMADQIIDLRRAGKTIAEICHTLELSGNAAMAAVQNVCLTHFGKRDLRGP